MGLSFRIFILLIWISAAVICAVLLFSKGFLLKRIVINNSSSCEEPSWAVNTLWNEASGWVDVDTRSHSQKSVQKCRRMVKPQFSKAVMVVIDGLRYDFLQFNPNLNASTAMPYQNKMKYVHEILKDSRNARLYKFEADPPTTTMQRIKGLTTGGLPTFIDAGTNWDSYRITEDNIIDHILQQGKNISFMGCSTWTELYPTQFHRKIPFSALNVKDLDTTDYGIIKNLVPEVKRSDWNLIVAHFLGVDHCGHRYGTNHYEMTRKITEMDVVIKNLVSAIDDDTILLVMGDHGMTVSGDHGGDSPSEVMAGLFAYSKKEIFPEIKEMSLELPLVSQIDLVPTISLLLDIPIPFSNLGSVIPDFFDADLAVFTRETQKSMKSLTSIATPSSLLKTVNLVYVSFLNCKQVVSYIQEYERVSADLPAHEMESIQTNFDYLEEKFTDMLRYLASVDWTNESLVHEVSLDELLLDLENTEDAFQTLLMSIKAMCRGVWAKFDILSMSFGLSILAFISVILVCCPFMKSPLGFAEQDSSKFLYVAGFGFIVAAYVYLIIPFEDTETASLITFGLISFSFSLWLLVCGFSTIAALLSIPIANLGSKLSFKSCFPAVLFLMYLVSLFANSYIIYEDASCLFIVQSLLVFNCVCHIYESMNYRISVTQAGIKRVTFLSLSSRVRQILISKHNLWIFGKTAVALVCLRWTKYFWFCREMQMKCSLSPYALPLVALLSEFNEGEAHERMLIAFLSLTVITLPSYYMLKKNGNLNGSTPVRLVVRYISFFIASFLFVHWILQLTLQNKFAVTLNIPTLQQIYFPRIVYFLCIVCIISVVYNPLGIYIVFRDKWNNIADQTDVDDTEITQTIFKMIRDDFSSKENEDFKAPLVYGLRTCYSSAFISLLLVFTLLSATTLMDGMALPVALSWISAWCVSSLLGLRHPNDSGFSSSAMFTSVLTWHFFASYVFFGSGHQTAIAAIRFQAAYIGFRGSLPEMVFQGLAVVLNTYWSHFLGAFSVPLLLIWRSVRPNDRKNSHNNAQQSNQTACEDSDADNELSLQDDSDLTRARLFMVLLLYLAISALKVSFTAASAALHRRHLMVWKIFAPRFLFEACFLLITLPSLVAGFGFFSRVDNCLKKWMDSLVEYTKLASKQ